MISANAVAILHDIRSVHNVGSIFRTADGAGFSRVICAGITPSPLDRFGKVRKDFAKVALGAHEHIRWEEHPDTLSVIDRLKRDGFFIVALEQHPTSQDLFRVSFPADRRSVLVVGNEVGGLSEDIVSAADVIAEIPMRGAKESLNVSVAFGIAAYALTRE